MTRWLWMLVLAAATGSAFAGDVTYEQTFTVEAGAWLEIDCPAGTILIDSWEKSQVELVAYHEPEVEVQSRQIRGDVQVGSLGDKEGGTVEYEVRVPVWMNVGIAGNRADVDIRGVDGRIEVDVVDGDVYVKGGKDKTILRSVKGDIDVQGCRGNMDLESTSGHVTVIDCRGELIVGSVNGDVRCENVVSSMVETETTNGDIFFDGMLANEGDYYFTTHVGDIDLNVPRDVNVEVTVITYQGDFDTDFQVKEPPQERGGLEQRRWSVQVGAGTAKLRAESFQGDIKLFSSKRGRPKRG